MGRSVDSKLKVLWRLNIYVELVIPGTHVFSQKKPTFIIWKELIWSIGQLFYRKEVDIRKKSKLLLITLISLAGIGFRIT